MVAGLIIVLGLAFVLIRFILPKTRLGRNRAANWIRLVDRIVLDPRLSVYLVKVMDRYLVLGRTDHATQLLTELSSSEGQRLEEKNE